MKTISTSTAFSSSSSSSSSLFSLILSLTISLWFLTLSATTDAQSSISPPSSITTTTATLPAPPTTPSALVAPSAFLGVASANSESYIYYQGGQLNVPTIQYQYSNELFQLDVTKPWVISSPAWTNLTLPNLELKNGPAVAGHSATMSKDGSTLFVTAPEGVNGTGMFLYAFDVATRVWSSSPAPSDQAHAWSNRREAQFLTDPVTGALWYLGGIYTGNGETNQIDRYLHGEWSTNLRTMTPPASKGDTSAVAISMNRFSSGSSHLWRSKIYLFGGFSSATGQRAYQSFQTLSWIDISTTSPTVGTQLTLGAAPPPRQDHCSVLTTSDKVILFGGYDANAKKTLSDIWTLDLHTWTWQQVVPITLSPPRQGHTCNLIGANMIVFGGRGNSNMGYLKDIQVYDIMLSSWMKVYSPKVDTTPVTQDGPGGLFGTKKGQLTTGGVIGIVAGVVGLVGIVLGVVFFRRRQRMIELKEAEMEKQAYLASLASSDRRKSRSRRHPRRSGSSPSTRRLNHGGGGGGGAYSEGGTSHSGRQELVSGTLVMEDGYSGGEEGHQAHHGTNVQYLMQHLPDGTIAVQPVYLDHQPRELRPSPDMMYSESSGLGEYFSQTLATGTTAAAAPVAATAAAPTAQPSRVSAGDAGISSASGSSHQNAPVGPGYIFPLPPQTAPTRSTAASNSSPAALPATSTSTPAAGAGAHSNSHDTSLPPTHDPFASPVMIPMPAFPPNYKRPPPGPKYALSLSTTPRTLPPNSSPSSPIHTTPLPRTRTSGTSGSRRRRHKE